MSKVLLLHHLEPMWNEGLKRKNTSFEEMEYKVYLHLKRVKYDKVILTRFEDYRLGPEYSYISSFVDNVYDYAYGWEKEMFTSKDEYCPGGNHSEVVYLPDWVKNLKGSKVSIAGAFLGECLEDISIALSYCKVKWKYISGLVV